MRPDGRDHRCKVCKNTATQTLNRIRKTAPPKPDKCDCCDAVDKKLYLDHCHITETFRGWICDNCNSGIGKLGDNLEGVTKAITYLQTHGNQI